MNTLTKEDFLTAAFAVSEMAKNHLEYADEACANNDENSIDTHQREHDRLRLLEQQLHNEALRLAVASYAQ